MKRLLFLLLCFVPFIGISQQTVTDEDIQAYIDTQQPTTIGYSFVVDEGKAVIAEDDIVIQIFNPLYRQIIQKKVVYLPDDYPFTEGQIWDYLKWRYKTYKNGEKQVPFEGYVKAEPITENIPYKKDLAGLLEYLKERKGGDGAVAADSKPETKKETYERKLREKKEARNSK